ncbi:metacaspase [Trypanosoma theileri]|uniref:Metacaspase n=1 Tax=Trypanosoma theileri TaxID=67003 RepID=A0A1X0NMB0_9TRYP|nr:metacaspase [Trypanosoma theileri]ORC85817.1 metacaspase [Trypanosoma theileri]
MGFDLTCIKNMFNVVQKARGAGGPINYMDIGLQLIKIAGPYVVQYLGEVSRPPHVDVDDAFEQAGNTQGYQPWEAPSPGSGNVRALFIGINYYGTSAQLSGCCNDVKQMLATFQKKRFPIKEVNILVDERNFPGRTEQPTRANIIRYMAWLVKDAKPGDVLFLHFSGHGTHTRALHDVGERYDQCIVPVDFRSSGCILDNDINKILVSRLPRGVRFTAVFDCCHSGSMLDLPFTFVGSRILTSAANGHMRRIRRGNFSEADVLMISGCADEQTSADVGNTAAFGTGATGAGGAATQCLTYTLLKTSNLSYQDTLIATRDMLRSKKFEQVPQLSATKPINLQQEFSLIKPFQIDPYFA